MPPTAVGYIRRHVASKHSAGVHGLLQQTSSMSSGATLPLLDLLMLSLQAQSWIDAALSSGGAVLVHCHEGKSRSVTLLLAFLMLSRGLTLSEALAHMRAVHPKASPNAGEYYLGVVTV